MYPKTIDEWREYVSSLSGEELRSKARAANSWTFVQMLQDEKMSPEDISELFRLFAAQFVQTGQMPPSDGGYTNYAEIADLDPELAPLYAVLSGPSRTMVAKEVL